LQQTLLLTLQTKQQTCRRTGERRGS